MSDIHDLELADTLQEQRMRAKLPWTPRAVGGLTAEQISYLFGDGPDVDAVTHARVARATCEESGLPSRDLVEHTLRVAADAHAAKARPRTPFTNAKFKRKAVT